LKNCLLVPPIEIFTTAKILIKAAEEHQIENHSEVKKLLTLVNDNKIRDWTESLWGKAGIYYQLQKKHGAPKTIDPKSRDPKRMPNKNLERELIERDGHFCRFCGIPVVRKEIRSLLNDHYPLELPWGKTNFDQHAAFQAMWLQFDHIIPHARGGTTTLENMIITCAPCNYGRMNFLLEEIELELSKRQSPSILNWTGLEELIP
jgi:hypothetical protein